MLLHNQQQFYAEDKAAIHNFLYPFLENAPEMDTPFEIRSFKITTPSGGTYLYR